MKKTLIFGSLISIVLMLVCFGSIDQRNIPRSFGEQASAFQPSPTAPSALPNQAPELQWHFPLVLRGIGTLGDAYYVSLQGSDSNPGSFTQPWKTLQHAADVVKAGDTVYIRQGIYHEAPRFSTSGTETSPIRILAYPGEAVVVEGDNRLPPSYRGLVSIFGDWVQISGLEIRNSSYIALGLYGKHNRANDIFAHHSQKGGIYVGGDDSLVENSRIWRNSLQNEFGASPDSWASGLTASNDMADHITERVVLRKNHVWENWGEGISTSQADGTILDGNITHDNFSTNIYISDAINILCQRNLVYMDPQSYVFGYGANSGIMLGDEQYAPVSANITIINNIAFGNLGNLWWWRGNYGGGMNNVLIAHNTFVNGIGNASDGRGGVIISRGSHQNVRFENNLIQQDGDLPAIATASQPGITYSHNLWSKPPQSAASGPGDIIANPLLAGSGDPFSPEWFRLTEGSPAIGHALRLPEVLADFFQLTRDRNPDMGAIEHSP